MEELLEKIAQAQEDALSEILFAVIDRYEALFPNWEISTISLEKNGDRNGQIDRIIQSLQAMKDLPGEL